MADAPEKEAAHEDFFMDIEPRVALIKLIPGTMPAIIESLAGCGVKGVVVEAFGLGGVRDDFGATMRKACVRADKGKYSGYTHQPMPLRGQQSGYI